MRSLLLGAALTFSSHALAQSALSPTEPVSLPQAQAALEHARASFRTCRNGLLQADFGEALSKLESARRGLEKGRRQAEALRRELEQERKRLEASRRAHGTTVEDRAEFDRGYAERLERTYTAPMKQVSALTAHYTAGIAGYAQVVEQYAQTCGQPKLGREERRQFLTDIAGPIAQVEAKASGLSDAVAALAAARPAGVAGVR